MLTQASIEALRLHFDASGLDGSETIYASRHENDTAFVAISSGGMITTFKNDGYPEALLEEEIMMLCCAKYDDRLTHIPREIDNEKFTGAASGSFRSIFIELIVAFIVLILGAFFMLIYWLLFDNLQNVLVIGILICLPVIFFILPKVSSARKDSGK